MKKLLALILVLMMVLPDAAASAETIYVQPTVDRDAAGALMASFGMEEGNMAMADAVLAFISALGIKVITVDDGAQIDLDLNGIDALSLGFAMDEESVTAVSTLFPNYVVTMTHETIAQMMESFSENMPGAENGEGGMDMGKMAALAEVFGGYFARYMEACSAAGVPGEPVTGEYEFEGYTFDTMVPVTVDMPAVVEATDALFEEMMNDEAVMGTIQSFVKDENGSEIDETDLRAAFGEWKKHIPDTASAEYYCNSDGNPAFYMIGEASFAEKEDSSYVFTMLYRDEASASIGFRGFEEPEMDILLDYSEVGVCIDFTMEEVYFGLDIGFSGDQLLCDIYFLDPEAPLASVAVTVTEGGERTLSLDKEGKTVLAVEDAMADEDAANGLIDDVMANGLGSLMGALSEALPDVAAMIGAMSEG